MRNEHLIGKVFQTNNYGSLIITKYVNKSEVHVKFVTTGYETKARLQHIKNGKVKDKSLPSVFDVGIIGDELISVNRKPIKEYQLWQGMLERCYSDKTQTRQPTYVGCSVSENFKYFPYFKDWCYKQIGFNQEGWQLDKDILIKGNKVYSEDTCVFVPQEINKLFIKSNKLRGKYPIGVSYDKGVSKFVATISRNNNKGCKKYLGCYSTPEDAFLAYKQAKEVYIKEVAEKWKDQIDIRVYEALMNYEVEIDD